MDIKYGGMRIPVSSEVLGDVYAYYRPDPNPFPRINLFKWWLS